MKKENGVTIVSLIIYVSALLILAVIIGRITTFFYNDIMNIQDDSAYSTVQSKLNYVLLEAFKDTDIADIEIGNFEYVEDAYIFSQVAEGETGSAVKITTGEGDQAKYKIVGLIGDQIYMDKTLLGDKVDDFAISQTYTSVEDKITYTIDSKVKVGKESYTHTYTSVID